MDFRIVHDFEIIGGNCIAVINCKITKTITNRLTYYTIAKTSYFASQGSTEIKIIGVWKLKN